MRVGANFTVPELTGGADIKLNERSLFCDVLSKFYHPCSRAVHSKTDHSRPVRFNGKVWRRHDGRCWIYKRFIEYRVIEMHERRSIGRTKIAKSALLFFSGQTGVRSCAVTDITNVGACFHMRGLPVLPLNFELSFDNFRTSRKCLLIWRDRYCAGVAFES
jgi:hypothetical protein